MLRALHAVKRPVLRRFYGEFLAIVPLFDTDPEFVEVCVVFTLVELLFPRTVVLTMFCEPIDVIVKLGPLPMSMPSLAAFTWPAALASWLCIVLESVALPVELDDPHILPEAAFEPLLDVLCA